MQFSTTFVAAISALAVSAAPSKTEEKRACSTVYPITSDNYNWMSRYYNPDYASTDRIVFHVPSGAAGACDLRLKLDGDHTAAWGNTQVEFKYQGGTGTVYTFSSNDVDGAYVGSFGCSDYMEFILQISPEQGKAGYVGFPQNNDNGLYITYGC